MEEYSMLFSFPNQSPSFVHGFEAGMLWREMEAGALTIKRTIHSINLGLVHRMATQSGYSFNSVPTNIDEWTNIELVKGPRIAVVQPPRTGEGG